MKKLFLMLFSFLLAFSMLATTAMAAEAPSVSTAYENIPIDVYVVDSVVPVSGIVENTYDNTVKAAISVDDLVSHSTNVVLRGSSYSGSYKSAKYSAGMPGYEYQISFDWIAEVNSSGDYIFKGRSIQNPMITTYTNHFLLATAWSYYNYSFAKNVWWVSSDGRTVSFQTDYSFTLYSKDVPMVDYSFTQENRRDISIDDLL